MVISLGKINKSFNEIASILPTLTNQSNILTKELGVHVGAVNSGYFSEVVDNYKHDIISIIVDKYEENICPFMNLGPYKRAIYLSFNSTQFDAFKVVDYLNEKVSYDLETTLFNQMLDGARKIFLSGLHYGGIDTNKKILRGDIDTFRGAVKRESLKSIQSFEELTYFIINNQHIYRQLPSKIAIAYDISSKIEKGDTSRWGLMTNGLLPFTINPPVNNPFSKAIFYVNGRVAFHFRNAKHRELMIAALQGHYAPIKITKLDPSIVDKFFSRDKPGRVKRVCKR